MNSLACKYNNSSGLMDVLCALKWSTFSSYLTVQELHSPIVGPKPHPLHETFVVKDQFLSMESLGKFD